MFVIATVLLAMGIPNLTAAVAELAPASRRGTGFAVLQMLVTAGAAAGPPLVGAISSATGSLGTGFTAMALVMAAGGLVLLTTRTRYAADTTATEHGIA